MPSPFAVQSALLCLTLVATCTGCLWVRPGSHVEPVRRQMARNPEYFGVSRGDTAASSQGSKQPPQMIFRELSKLPGSPASSFESPAKAWDGMFPHGWDPITHSCEGLFQAGFLPVECEAGDLLVFAGELDHLSLPNYSNLPRHTFQLHAIEGPAAGITWSPDNWLQYPDSQEFPPLGVRDAITGAFPSRFADYFKCIGSLALAGFWLTSRRPQSSPDGFRRWPGK